MKQDLGGKRRRELGIHDPGVRHRDKNAMKEVLGLSAPRMAVSLEVEDLGDVPGRSFIR